MSRHSHPPPFQNMSRHGSAQVKVGAVVMIMTKNWPGGTGPYAALAPEACVLFGFGA
jgi:hypothetical protein